MALPKAVQVKFYQRISKSRATKIILEDDLFSFLEEEGLDTGNIENDLNRIRGLISREFNKLISQGTTPHYRFADYDNSILLRNDLYTDDQDVKEKVENKLNFQDEIKDIVSEIHWKEFEGLCARILELCGSSMTVTRSSKDDGIDFYGYFDASSDQNLNRFQRTIRFRILGQAKHTEKGVAGKVSHGKVTSFYTEYLKFVKDNYKDYFLGLDDDFKKSDMPILPVFITNGTYEPKTLKFAEDTPLILWNGEQISEDLSGWKELTQLIKDPDAGMEAVIKLINKSVKLK